MTVSAMTPAAWMSWSRAVLSENGPVGVGAWPAVGGVGHCDTQRLVGDEQGVQFLVDAVGGAGPQDASAEDRGLDL